MKLCLQLACLVATISLGCTVQSGVEPLDQVITASSDREFGFVDQWNVVRPSESPAKPVTISIAKNVESTGYLVTATDPSVELFEVTFSATEVLPDKPRAIAELELVDASRHMYRRLGYATVQNDELRVWSIKAQRLGELLYAAAASAVIEDTLLSTNVRCKPDVLLKIVKENAKELLRKFIASNELMAKANSNAMHAELRWCVFLTFPSHSPQPGDCGRWPDREHLPMISIVRRDVT